MKLSEKLLNKGNTRSIRARKNIIILFVIKSLNVAVGLIFVPLTIHYLDPVKYGIWVTLSSIISWFAFFDIGLGHGLRNRFTEALSVGSHVLARKYVSTTYAALTVIVGCVLCVFYFINPFLRWDVFLNVGDELDLQSELSSLALVAFTFFCLQFVFKLISTILLADQRPALSSFFDLFGKIIILIIIFILTKTTEGSLLKLGIVMSAVPVIVLIISNIILFSGKYKKYSPSVKFVDFSIVNELLNLGVKFFGIQIATVLLYQTNNIIISNLFGPAEVTPYNIVFKYFSILLMGFSIVLSPFWSAFTEAWLRNEIGWIKKIIQKLLKVWCLLFVCGVIMLVVSPWAYKFWVGSDIAIPYSMSALVAAWVLLMLWNSIFGNFLNGVGKIKLQLYLGMGGAIVNIPLAFFLGSKIGVEGVIISNIIVSAAGVIIYPLQYSKLVNDRATGIWCA